MEENGEREREIERELHAGTETDRKRWKIRKNNEQKREKNLIDKKKERKEKFNIFCKFLPERRQKIHQHLFQNFIASLSNISNTLIVQYRREVL